MAPQEARWKPTLYFDDNEILFNPAPTFLGIKFDRTLSFRPHTQALQEKLHKRINVLKSLAGRTWGMEKEELRAVYITYISSSIDYCAAAYLPAMPKTILDKLQILQNSAARIITGCCRDTPVDLLNVEASLTPIQVKAEIKEACAYDKSLRQPTDNPTVEPAKAYVRRRLKSQPSWRESAKETLSTHNLLNLPREKLHQRSNTAPWDLINRITMSDQLIRKCSKRDPAKSRNLAATQTLQALPVPDVQLWTDGSAVQSTTNGGGGVLIFGNEMGETELLAPAGLISSSYRAEYVAFKTALEWIRNNPEFVEGKTVHIYTDSKSLVNKLQAGPQVAREMDESK